MTELYPLFFKPVFKPYIWGGRNLEKLGRVLPEGTRVAESWEISSHKDGMTIIENGVHKGKTLPQLMEIMGVDLVGKANQWALDRGKFPLLVKLLDANHRLSVQVHPDDAYALQHEGNELGKTEMWFVLWAAPGASIIYGLSKKTSAERFRQALDEGQLEPFLNKISIQSGDHICVPTGTLHAILGGALIAEIQQNSNTTYRVYDWNRKNDEGHLRPLHIAKALDVINFDQIGARLSDPVTIEQTDNWSIKELCKNQYFTSEQITVKNHSFYTGYCNGTTLEIWGVLKGNVKIDRYRVEGIKFFLLPANLGEFTLEIAENSVLLRTYTS